MRSYLPASWGDMSASGSFRGLLHGWVGGCGPRSVLALPTPSRVHDGVTDAMIGFSEAVIGLSETPGTLLFLSKAIVGVGASVPLKECLRGVSFASGNVCTASFVARWALPVARAAPGVVKSLPRVSSAVAWIDPCSPAPFVVIAGPAPFVASATPSGVFVPPAE